MFRAKVPLAERQASIARIRNGWRLQFLFHKDNVRRIREKRSKSHD